MNITKKELMKQMTDYSVKEERLMCLAQLASYMIGKINVSEGKIADNDEINQNYSYWMEAVLDAVSEIAQNQNTTFDALVEMVDHLK